ncbi:hypothetical protein AERO9AM_10285 [Aeromicrobium sp. 9AM]|nr:hypothetical protein AERO9AM_10285 [Aeromicrobium sp. 9AM]
MRTSWASGRLRHHPLSPEVLTFHKTRTVTNVSAEYI